MALSTPQTTIVITRTTSSPAASPITGLPVARPTVPYSPTAVNDPIMNSSPWAKLISSMIP